MNGVLNGFNAGMLTATAISIIVVILVLGKAEKFATVDAIEKPVYVFSVNIDGETFTCRREPTVTSKGLFLSECQELYGDYVRIANYKSFSFKAVNVE